MITAPAIANFILGKNSSNIGKFVIFLCKFTHIGGKYMKLIVGLRKSGFEI